MHLDRTHHQGQTLLEALIAIGVILTAVIGSATLIISTITAGRVSQNKVEAANFAREGIEIVRSIRDGNWLKFEQNVINPTTNEITAWNTDIPANSTGVQRILIFRYSTNNTTAWTFSSCGSTVTCPNRSVIYRAENSEGTIYTQAVTLASCESTNGAGNCTATKYSRIVTLTTKTDDLGTASTADDLPYILVESTVRWRDRIGTRSLTAETRLYDWK